MRFRSCTLMALAGSAALLAACGNSRDPLVASPGAAVTAKCQGEVAPDHSARSLPVGLTPRPGPEALYLPPPRAPQLENAGVWQALPILVSGASAYRCGEFLYQDWLYDDHGAAGTADPDDPQAAQSYLFSPKAGSLSYPTDPVLANNAADLVEFRLRPLADATALRITLNTLQDAERMAFTVAIGDSDAAHDWPHGAGVASPAEWFLTVHGTSAELRRAADGSALAPAPEVRVDAERQQVEVRIAHAAWNPGRRTVRFAAGFGVWDSSGYAQPAPSASATAPGGLAPSGAALFNLAFRSQEPAPDLSVFSGRTIGDAAALARAQGHWWRARLQADALADGDVGAFFAEVDFAKLLDRRDDDSAVPSHGHMNRIHASRNRFGQGANYAKDCGGVSPVYPCDGVMVGQLQPYAIYIPEGAPPASGYGLTLLLHALSANYNQYLDSRHAESLGERGAGSIVITPAARGPDGYYKDTAEADVFEVWADVARRWPLDPDWVSVTGVSMGGFGTFRLATRYPDLFARAMTIVASAVEYDGKLDALRNVPLMMWTSALDELQPVSGTEPDVQAVLDQGLRLDAWRFETWDHLSPSTNDFYAPAVDFLGSARVERNPARISYHIDASEDFDRHGVVARAAYWASGIEPRDPGLPGSIDLRSEGFGVADAVPLAVAQSNAVFSGGYLEPAPYTRRLLDWQPPATAPVRDRLVIRARNVSRVVIDPVRARLGCRAAREIDSDGPLEVVLRGCG